MAQGGPVSYASFVRDFLYREPVVDRERRLLMRATLGEGEQAIEAYHAWRRDYPLDDIQAPAYRLMPLLVATVERHGIDDPEIKRMRGIGKHIWFTNLLRTKVLSNALSGLANAGIDTLLMKGAALFARYPKLATIRVTEDYDLLVRRSQALSALKVMAAAGFEPAFDLHIDDLDEDDFERMGLHACPFVTKPDITGNLDIHWMPLPYFDDIRYADEMFTRAEVAELGGQAVSIASLSDHLFMTLVRAEPWEKDEMLFRAIEAAQIIGMGGGRLDWNLVERLVDRLGFGSRAASILQLVEDELTVPLPAGIVRRLRGRQAILNRLDHALGSIRPDRRTRLQKLSLAAVRTAKLERSGSSVLAAATALGRKLRSGRRASLFSPTRLLRSSCDGRLRELWKQYAAGPMPQRMAFRHGFSFPETGGRWTDGRLSVIELPVDATSAAALRIRLTVRAFLPLDRSLFRFDVVTGPEQRQRIELSAGANRHDVSLLAQPVGTTAKKVVLAFELLDAEQPIALGLSADPRLLGLFVENIEVDLAPRPSLPGRADIGPEEIL